jgi:hypothetical protein
MTWDSQQYIGSTILASDWNSMVSQGIDLPQDSGFYIYPNDNLTTYYAVNKDTNNVVFSDRCAGNVINQCIGATSATALITLGPYTYSIRSDGIHFGQKAIRLEGVTPGPTLVNYGTRICCVSTYQGYFIDGGAAGTSFSNPVVRGIHLDAYDSTWPAGGISFTNVSHAHIERVFIDDFFNPRACGIHFFGEHGQSCYYNVILNYCIRRCSIGIDFDSVVNANWIYGGHIAQGRTPPLNTTYVGMYFHGGNSNHICDVDIEAFGTVNAIGVWISTSSGANEFRGLRCEGNWRDIVIDAGGGTGDNRFIGGSSYSVITSYIPVVDNGNQPSYFVSRLGWKNDKWNYTTISNGGTIAVVNHTLDMLPKVVTATGSSSETADLYVTSITATQFTIVSNTPTTAIRTVYWRAMG